jgi:hypothetical protein
LLVAVLVVDLTVEVEVELAVTGHLLGLQVAEQVLNRHLA